MSNLAGPWKLCSSELDREFQIVDSRGFPIAKVFTVNSAVQPWLNKKTSPMVLWKQLTNESERAKTNAMVLAIIVGAMLYGFILTVLQIPQQLTELVTSMDVNRWVVFLAINILLLFLGCILETVSIILITVPILYPLILKLGFDPIWFAVIMVINMEMALITPPVGMNLFVIQGITPGTRMTEILRGVLPFAMMMIATMAILAWAPELATWLPKVLMK